MANIRNIDAEVGANFIGDDAQPTLRIENSSTGPGLSVDSFLVTSGATILGNTSTALPLTITRATLGGPTAATLAFVSSVASGPILELRAQSFISAVSIVFAASANWAGMGVMPVKRSDGTIGFIPVLPPAVVTAAAVNA